MPFGVIFAWDARRHAPAPSLINANRPSRRVCRLQRRRSARRSSLSARLPGLPSRWPAYFFVRPRGTCSARAAVVGFCARPWGRITLQWRDGALPGPFKRRGCVCAGAACVRHASAPHSLHIPKCGEPAHRVLSPSDIYGGQRSNICEWPAPRPTVRPLAPAADLRHGRHERPASLPSLAFVVVLLAPLCICLHNAARRRDSSELGGTRGHWAGQGQVLAQVFCAIHPARAPAARRWVQFALPAPP